MDAKLRKPPPEKKNNLLSKLLTEHDHIRKTLNLLEIQFLDLCRNRPVDYAVMLSIVVYMQEYPEQAHHPLEDAIFSAIARKGGRTVQLARALVSDHNELEVITRRLRRSLESRDSSGVFEDKLKRQLSRFLLRQRRHLHFEETEIYPLIRQTLTQRDWGDIQSAVAPIDDPVFGERTRNDYERMYKMIEDEPKSRTSGDNFFEGDLQAWEPTNPNSTDETLDN